MRTRPLARHASLGLLLLLPLAGAAGGPAAAVPPEQAPAAVETGPRVIPGQYLVTLDPAAPVDDVLAGLGIAPMFVYGTVRNGFAATLSAEQLAAVREVPAVTAVEANAVVEAEPAPASDLFLPPDGTAAERSAPAGESWGLDRIDQRTLPLDGRYEVSGTGRGVTAYIVDTGLDFDHEEFGGRAVAGYDAVDDGRAGADCHGHGTHVAGIVGGASHGVAREVDLVSVRILDCDGRGSTAGVLAALDWVAAEAQQPAVLNASVGGGASRTVDEAFDAVAARGTLPVVSAGNNARDACDASPAGAERVFTVGATDREDRPAGFSNVGRCLELFAPGVDIVSARLGGGTVAMSGTSQAAPHTAGVAALFKEERPGASPEGVGDWLVSASTADVLSSPGGDSPDRLLYTGGL
ncbi:S8 family peptidase [Streptomyces bohaiensis]|uniref:S8 family peptidase n=1 Tax=Streptomyces bohaiensis TaxID=1431344 RepID=A0ABX1CFZ8_9ACTN|nr:S8 family peptidase [Streptomyces bohaiensis]NJQ17972.1 S8 family peptidase [Streptomyces bohaiensis]